MFPMFRFNIIFILLCPMLTQKVIWFQMLWRRLCYNVVTGALLRCYKISAIIVACIKWCSPVFTRIDILESLAWIFLQIKCCGNNVGTSIITIIQYACNYMYKHSQHIQKTFEGLKSFIIIRFRKHSTNCELAPIYCQLLLRSFRLSMLWLFDFLCLNIKV